MIASPKFYTGGLGSLSGLLRNVTAAPAPAKAAAPAPVAPSAPQALVGPPAPTTVAPPKTTAAPPVSTPAITPVDKLVVSGGVSAPAPAPATAKPTKLQTVSSYSAPAGTVINAATVDALLKQNIDKGDPNLVTGEALKSLEQKGKIDPSLGNLLSSNAAVAKGAAALGVTKTETINQLGGTKSVSYSGDLAGAAKSLGIDTAGFTKTISGPMGTTQTIIDKEKLYNAVNDRANQIGLYAITERDPGKTGSSDNATHITTYYQNTNGVLQPLKDANGKTATTTFKADTYTKDEGFFEGLVSGVRGIATELSPIISMALPNLGLTGLQLLAAQSAQAIATGASPTDVLKGAIGSLAAAQVPQFLDELKVVSAASPALKSAINNAAVQATFAAFTDQNIALNAIAGAIGGAAAELSKDLGDPALQKAIGEFTKNKALGMSDMQAGMAAAQDYAQSISGKKAADRTAAQNQVIDAFSQPRTAGVGTQIGEATAATGAIYSDPEAAREAARMGIELPSVGVTTPSLISGKELPAVTVTGTREPVILTPTLTQNLGLGGRVDKKTPTTVPPNLDIANLISQGASTTGKTTETPSGVIDTTQPAGTSSDAGVSASNLGTGANFDSKIIDLTGIGGGGTSGIDFGGGEGTSGAGAAGTGASGIGTGETGTVGTGIDGTGTGGDGEGGDGSGDGTTETASQTFPLTPQQPDTVILDLISGGGTRRGQRLPTASESESMAALTQALRIGDPGDALFGGKLGRRRNVWNVESLRLKDELGG